MLYAPPIDMTLQEALCTPSSDVLIYDTFNAAACAASSAGSFLLAGNDAPALASSSLPAPMAEVPVEATPARENRMPPGRRKRRRRERRVKSREDAESQRMTHIAVERNRRRQMNEYLAVLRSLMPDSYVHRVLAGRLTPEHLFIVTMISSRVTLLCHYWGWEQKCLVENYTCTSLLLLMRRSLPSFLFIRSYLLPCTRTIQAFGFHLF
jgi:hypothetical protein